jgi:hypothetical protein
MFFDMVERIARKAATTTKETTEKRNRATKAGRLDSNADAFLAKHGYDPNGNPVK